MHPEEKLDFALVGVNPNVPYQLKRRVAMDLTGTTVYAGAGDVGGLKAIEGPLKKVCDAGGTVVLLLVGSCAKQHQEEKDWWDKRFETISKWEDVVMIAALLHEREDNCLTVIASSQSPEGAKLAADMASHSYAPVLAVQDVYKSLNPTLELLGAAVEKIDRICLTDAFSQDLILNVPVVVPQQCVITGGPQYDKVAQLREHWQVERSSLRGMLSLTDHELVFLLVGGLNGSAEMLYLVNEALGRAGLYDRARIIYRPHSRATELDKALADAYKVLMRSVQFVDTSAVSDSMDLLLAADFVCSGYSTVNYAAILCGIAGTVYVGTPSYRWDLWREKQVEQPPEVGAGAGWYVQDAVDLVAVFKKYFAVPGLHPAMCAAQTRICQYNDGHAADRVFDEMVKLLE